MALALIQAARPAKCSIVDVVAGISFLLDFLATLSKKLLSQISHSACNSFAEPSLRKATKYTNTLHWCFKNDTSAGMGPEITSTINGQAIFLRFLSY